MSEKNASQVQQGTETFRRITEEQVNRTNALFEESRKLEQRFLEQANQTVDETARLIKGGLAFATQLSAEYRRITTDALQRSMDLFSVRS